MNRGRCVAHGTGDPFRMPPILPLGGNLGHALLPQLSEADDAGGDDERQEEEAVDVVTKQVDESAGQQAVDRDDPG